MPKATKESYIPACASFGPLFMVQGYAVPNYPLVSAVIGYAGAFATSFALFTLYKMQTELKKSAHSDAAETQPAQ